MLMIGAVSDNSAKIWVKGQADDAEARLILHRFNNDWQVEQVMALLPGNGLTNVHKFVGLHHDTEYWCEAVIGDENFETEVFRTFPSGPSGAFTFMISSCNRVLGQPEPGNKDLKRSIKAFQGLNRIASEENARFMIHSGDQIYIDTLYPDPSVTSEEQYRARYDQTWGNAPTQYFFGKLPHFMTLDDHELCNEFDNDLTEHLHVPVGFYKEWGLKAYREYQHSHNPDTPEGQYYYAFEYGDVCFFVMDVRTERHMYLEEMIGDEQMEAFISWLEVNRERRKFVITAVPFLAKVGPGGKPSDKWYGAPFNAQRISILEKLLTQNTKNLVFLSGDVHAANRTVVTLAREEQRCRLWEFISGPLNQDVVNGDILFDNHDHHSPIPGATYTYRSRCYTHENLIANFQNGLSQANVLVVTVDGNKIYFKWLPVQKAGDPIKEISIDLETGEEIDA